jgi:hypothetical protein
MNIHTKRLRRGYRFCSTCKTLKKLNDNNFSRSTVSKEGYFYTCAPCSSERSHEWRKVHNTSHYHQHQREHAKQKRRTARIRVIQHYGGRCFCCGEDMLDFLAIDHKNNDGAQHRREMNLSGSGSMYLWIIRNHFPDMFQVLCHNCNMAKAFYGICPHSLSIWEIRR